MWTVIRTDTIPSTDTTFPSPYEQSRIYGVHSPTEQKILSSSGQIGDTINVGFRQQLLLEDANHPKSRKPCRSIEIIVWSDVWRSANHHRSVESSTQSFSRSSSSNLGCSNSEWRMTVDWPDKSMTDFTHLLFSRFSPALSVKGDNCKYSCCIVELNLIELFYIK